MASKINLTKSVLILEDNQDQFTVINDILDTGKQEDAFYINDLTCVIKQFENWKKLMPRVDPFYAMKCNNSDEILKTLIALGAGFDCASKGEIQQLLKLGGTADRIIYANPTKPISHLKYAEKHSVSKMSFDNDVELYKINKIYPNAELVLRIRCDSKTAHCRLGDKFGCNVENEAPRLLKLAASINANVIGVAFHVGSGCLDATIYETGIKLVKDLFEYGDTIGLKLHFVDIGGGFPGNIATNIDEFAMYINRGLEKWFPKQSNVTVIAEPGRYFAAASSTLLTNVHSIRKDYDGNNQLHKISYYMNESVHGSFICAIKNYHITKPQPLKARKNDNQILSTLWGGTMKDEDKVFETIYLPELNINEWIYFFDMGAYRRVSASEFNGVPISKIVSIIKREYQIKLRDSTSEFIDYRDIAFNLKSILPL